MGVTKPSKYSFVETTANLMKRMKMTGNLILVKALPLELSKKSKLIIPESEQQNLFNYGRGEVISKGEACKRDYLKPGMEVYFPRNLGSQPNYPNAKKSDKAYYILSEESVAWYL